MSYLYETHLHTRRGSACGVSYGPDYVKGYRDLGYDGIFVTDHFYLGNTVIPRSLPWNKWVDNYYASYLETKEAGDKIGLKVFFGWETSYGTGEDFLIYGPGPDFLKAHPEIISLTQKEQFLLLDSCGALVVQAHPFRERDYMSEIQLHPLHCHAWEIYNAGNEAYMDANARNFVKNLSLPHTCGSDIHRAEQLKKGQVFAMETEEPLNSEWDYVKLIRAGKKYVLRVPEDRIKAESIPPYLEVFLYDEKSTTPPVSFGEKLWYYL